MRIGSLVLIVWLIIGAIAGGQRNYYSSSDPNCSRAGTITVTVLAGPLSWPPSSERCPGSADLEPAGAPLTGLA